VFETDQRMVGADGTIADPVAVGFIMDRVGVLDHQRYTARSLRKGGTQTLLDAPEPASRVSDSISSDWEESPTGTVLPQI